MNNEAPLLNYAPSFVVVGDKLRFTVVECQDPNVEHIVAESPEFAMKCYGEMLSHVLGTQPVKKSKQYWLFSGVSTLVDKILTRELFPDYY